MIEIIVIAVFSLLNCIGLLLWFCTMIISMDVVYCKHNLNFRRFLSRNICVQLSRLKRKLNLDKRFSASLLIFIGSIIAILMKVTELREVLDLSSWKVCGRVITSLLLPSGFMLLYKALGYKSSFFNNKSYYNGNKN